ncbi:substrate-binding domain-containing protein [Actinocorallia sp. B10E7]|uniref:substrate-binding domain-containing protein n=1 Tax=Actinocorallia sp. B10E7 TaxID=3153558 RepID=UPI00325D1017
MPINHSRTLRIGRSSRSAAVGVSLVAALLAGACGNSATQPSTGEKRSIGRITVPDVPEADLKATLDRVFTGAAPAVSELDPTVVAALKTASVPLTPEQKKIADRCSEESSCDTGTGSVTIAMAESFGQATRRKVFRREMVEQAVASGRVRKIIHLDARGDLQTFLSNFRSLVTQNVDVVFSAFDFGASALPQVKDATAKGILVVPVTTGLAGATPGEDYAFDVATDVCSVGTQMAEAAVKAGGENGSAAVYTGPAGNQYAAQWQPCLKKVLDAHGWKTTLSGNTDWTPQGEAKIAATLAGSKEKPDALFYDSAPTVLLKALLDADKPAPFVVSNTATYEYLKFVHDENKKGTKIDAQVAPFQSWLFRVGVTGALLRLSGEKVADHVQIPSVFAPASTVYDLAGDGIDTLSPLLPAFPLLDDDVAQSLYQSK